MHSGARNVQEACPSAGRRQVGSHDYSRPRSKRDDGSISDGDVNDRNWRTCEYLARHTYAGCDPCSRWLWYAHGGVAA